MTTLILVLAFAALVGGAWCLYGARAEWRRRAALDRYAERELAKEAYLRRSAPARVI